MFQAVTLGLGILFSIPAVAGLRASPEWLRFSTTKVGFSTRQFVTVSNFTKDTVDNIRWSDFGDHQHFYVNDFRCSTIYAGSSCSLDITFRPTREGRFRLSIEGSSAAGWVRIQAEGEATE